jgi:uncharacterized iron-regulated protein
MLNRSLIAALFLLIPIYIQTAWSSDYAVPENSLEVSFDIPSSKIRGVSRISVNKGEELPVHMGSLRIISLKVNGIDSDLGRDETSFSITANEDGVIEIGYEGVLKAAQSPDPESPMTIQSVIDGRGISLTDMWYPEINGPCYFTLKATLPEGYEAVSEAEEIRKVSVDGKVEHYFSFPYPLEGINLIASDMYVVKADSYRDVKIYSYFFKEDASLAGSYIEFTKRYLELYEGIIGKYPYKRFSIAENFLPTGFSMPTFTMLGSAVVRLPFIVETSLGHEILHQWFGNHVYMGSENWTEGLTTYLADQLYMEEKGEGWDYRKQILIDHHNYVSEKNDFPVRGFRARFDHASRTIGYGKAAMVFHMLRDIVGDNIFFGSLRDFINENRFKRASWDDLISSFQRSYNEDLDWFFTQWINETGVPSLEMNDTGARYVEGGFELSFSIKQKGPLYEMTVPVTVYSGGEGIKRRFRITEKENKFKIYMSYEPEKIVMDGDYDVARSLHKEEVPPVVSGLLGASDLMVALPVRDKRFYKGVIDDFKKKGASVKRAKDIKDSEIGSYSVIVLGSDNPVISRLFGNIDEPEAGFSIIIKENPWNPDKVIGVFNGTSKKEVSSGFRKLRHYGKYSRLLFDSGANISKETDVTQRGISMDLKKEPLAVDMSSVKTLSDVINDISGRKIIYIGEFHDVFAHHAVQLDIIRGLYRMNKDIAIGMEMFQRPFQKTLDDYIEERIDEKEFLKKTEYFKRWRFDYNLYKPILDFAKSNMIPLLALNMEREIIEKVSKDGIDSLSRGDRKSIPSEMDFSDLKYRERVRWAFKMHKDWEEKNFDHFFQSQVLWDETMAQSADVFLKDNKDRQMIVIAGQGHLEYGSGIPKRTYRRNGYDYAIVLIDADLEEGIADHVIFPKPVEGVTSPRLMVFLNIEDDMLEVTGFSEKSVSEKAGLRVGDIIVSVNDVPSRTIEDVKIELFSKRKGGMIKVEVLRKEDGKETRKIFNVRL